MARWNVFVNGKLVGSIPAQDLFVAEEYAKLRFGERATVTART